MWRVLQRLWVRPGVRGCSWEPRLEVCGLGVWIFLFVSNEVKNWVDIGVSGPTKNAAYLTLLRRVVGYLSSFGSMHLLAEDTQSSNDPLVKSNGEH